MMLIRYKIDMKFMKNTEIEDKIGKFLNVKNGSLSIRSPGYQENSKSSK